MIAAALGALIKSLFFAYSIWPFVGAVESAYPQSIGFVYFLRIENETCLSVRKFGDPSVHTEVDWRTMEFQIFSRMVIDTPCNINPKSTLFIFRRFFGDKAISNHEDAVFVFVKSTRRNPYAGRYVIVIFAECKVFNFFPSVMKGNWDSLVFQINIQRRTLPDIFDFESNAYISNVSGFDNRPVYTLGYVKPSALFVPHLAQLSIDSGEGAIRNTSADSADDNQGAGPNRELSREISYSFVRRFFGISALILGIAAARWAVVRRDSHHTEIFAYLAVCYIFILTGTVLILSTIFH